MTPFLLRPGLTDDIVSLLEIEILSFETDRFSQRSFLRWLQSPHAQLMVACDPENSRQLLGYGLVVYQQGTRLSRLYSLAVRPASRHHGVGKALLQNLERDAVEEGRLAMRLEVESGNLSAIRLFSDHGYRAFAAVIPSGSPSPPSGGDLTYASG